MLKNSLFLVLLFTSFLFSCSKTENNNEEPWDLVNFSFHDYESQNIILPEGKVKYSLSFLPYGRVKPIVILYSYSSTSVVKVFSLSDLYYTYNPNNQIMKISGQTDFFNGIFNVDGDVIHPSLIPLNIRQVYLNFDNTKSFIGTYKYQNDRLISIDSENPTFIIKR